jgi:calcineurin-like phosphoesterase family protein
MDSYNNKDVFFSSDLHFGHKNILKYTDRSSKIGSSDVDVMNGFLVDSWNRKVKKDSVVYLLGDLAFCGITKLEPLVSRLNGQIHYVMGNHDHFKVINKLRDKFISVSHYRELKVDGQAIVMCHYPLYSWNQCQKGSWCLHGHEHGSINEHDHSKTKKIMDVGVDCSIDLSPFSYEEVKGYMELRSAMPHHNHVHEV